MAKPETTACWFKQGMNAKWEPGRFHQLGAELSTVEGEGNFTVGVVEDDKGAMHADTELGSFWE